MADKQFLNGIRAFKPRENAPSFVKANLVINKAELIEFLESQPDEVRVSMKESQKGSYYLEVDTYQGNGEIKPKQPSQPANDIPTDDLPF